jgi:hypothetical protein
MSETEQNEQDERGGKEQMYHRQLPLCENPRRPEQTERPRLITSKNYPTFKRMKRRRNARKQEGEKRRAVLILDSYIFSFLIFQNIKVFRVSKATSNY